MSKLVNLGKNKIYLVVGPSGVGKTTVIKSTFEDSQQLLSVTTRPKRKGEVTGKDYYFITNEEFDNLIEKEELIQQAEYGGNRYGITFSELKSKLKKGDVVIAVVYESYLTYKELFPKNYVGVFLEAPEDIIKERLGNRGGQSEIDERLKLYHKDMENKKYFTDNKTNFILNLDKSFEENVSNFQMLIYKSKH